jgi:calcineurin-like phosphoesterase family protein
MPIWFTSDQHFGHSNIIKHRRRPFSDTQEMDKALLAKWSSVIGSRDIVGAGRN